jgi:hypothetical protein
MATIDLSNYTTSLYRASSAAFTDGNAFFDISAGTLEITDATTTPTLNLTTHGGGASDPNPVINLDGVRLEAGYAFENQERRNSAGVLRGQDRFIQGTFKFGGAYEFVNGRTPANDATRKLFRGSGWRELTGAVVNRIYFGPKGLGAIVGTSIPSYQPSQYGSSVDFTKLGNIDEAIQVFGDAANGNFDNTLSSHYFSIRTYGKNYDRIDTLGTLGITELGGYSSGAALSESDHLTTSEGAYALADVYGGSQIAPWDGMTLEKLSSAQVETGFAGADGNFTWTLNNTGAGSLFECVAYLDAIAQADAVVTTGTASLNGKDYDVWYDYTATGKIRPITGADDGLGVFIEGLTGADKQLVSYLDNGDVICVYPVFTAVSIEFGQGAIDDPLAWFNLFTASTYNTATPVDYDDALTVPVKGDVSNTSVFITGANTFASFEHDFTTDGSVNVIIICEGDGGVTQQKTAVTLSDSTVSASCVPAVENNA